MIHDADGLIVIDSALADGPPGTVKSWDRDTLLAKPLTPRTNPHAPGLLETLWTLRLAERGPSEVRLIGVVPQATEVGIGMCPEVRAAVPGVVQAVVDTLVEWEFAPRLASPPRRADLWWERATTPAGARAVGARTPAPAVEEIR
jgi:Ni,Fe-hydrogenase maturation factor